MSNLTKNITLQRVVSAGTLGVLLIALQATGVLGTFYNGITNYSSSNTYTFNSTYGYGYGYDSEEGKNVWGYGYGASLVTTNTNTSGSSSSGGGGSPSVATSDDVTTGSSSSTTNGGGGSTSSATVCTNTMLLCKDAGNGVYKLFKKSGKTCTDGNLGKTCIPQDEEVVDGVDVTPVVVDPINPDTPSCTFPNVNVSYTDTAGNWAIAYINELSSKGIMNGNTSGLLNPVGIFEPSRSTTRTEFLKIALRAYCYEYINENTSSLSFSDVDKASWQARVIKKGVDLGIVTAANSTFRPNDSISRIEAIKMLLRVAQTRNDVYQIDESVTTTSFSDITTTWQAKYVEKAKQLNIIANNPTFNPNNGIKRDETAKVVSKSRLLHY